MARFKGSVSIEYSYSTGGGHGEHDAIESGIAHAYESLTLTIERKFRDIGLKIDRVE